MSLPAAPRLAPVPPTACRRDPCAAPGEGRAGAAAGPGPGRPAWVPGGAEGAVWLPLGLHAGRVVGVGLEQWSDRGPLPGAAALLVVAVTGPALARAPGALCGPGAGGPGCPSAAGSPREVGAGGLCWVVSGRDGAAGAWAGRAAEGMVLRDGQLRGWLAVAGPAPRALWTAAAAALAARPAWPRTGPAQALVDGSGAVIWADPPGRRWMAAPGRRAQVAALLAAGRQHWVDGAAVRVGWGAGRDGALALISVVPSAPVPAPPVAALTPGQYRVAVRAAAGCTVAEIAAETGRSTQTVRSHLKAVYRRLGVTSRVALVRCFGAWGGGA